MPVIVLTPNLTGHDGVSHLSRLVTRAYEDVTVLALHEAPSCRAFEHAPVVAAGGSSARFAKLGLQLAARATAETTVILVHVHLAPAALAFVARSPLVTCLCGIEAWVPLSWPRRAALQRSRRVWAISAHTAARFREANPRLASLDVAVCHLGIAESPASAALPVQPPTALIVGRMAADERYKGHDALLDAWRAVTVAVPGARLEIAGDGDDRARLEARSAELGLQESVAFLGRVPDAELQRCYDRCTALVMPSRDEGFGLVFLEAMRAGRACIGLRGAASEIIVPGRTGEVVETTDRDALAQAIASVIGDSSRAAQMGRNGREQFLDRFTERQFRQRLHGLVPNPAVAGAHA